MLSVSIPDRDSVELKAMSALLSEGRVVSIPDRDSVELKDVSCLQHLVDVQFQSLIGIQLN